MVRFQWSCRSFLCAVLLAFLGACGDEEFKGESRDSWHGVCIDRDQDGYGFECDKGPDCDDTDPTLNVDCGCAVPAKDCACDPGSQPVPCTLSREHTESGGLLCKTGERYCRDGAWTECIGIRSFEVPAPVHVKGALRQALIDLDAAPEQCLDPCAPDCYRVEDPLGEDQDVDAAVPGGHDVVYTPGGHITLDSYLDEPGPGGVPPDPTDIWQCDMSVDSDCNGIPDDLDEYHGKPKVGNEFPTIFMELGPGESDSRGFDVEFLVNSLDVYFLVDATGSMGGSIKKILDSLTKGNYLGGYTKPCAAVIPEGQPNAGEPDNSLKDKGITGAIACKIRDAAFGAGWFREIPFSPHASNWYLPFAHVQDIDTDPNKTLAAFTMFSPATNNSDYPESGIVALHAVATGEAQYMGWDRPGIPPRTCPDPVNQFGYPCFRRNAVPVVLFITDAQQHNGPGQLASSGTSDARKYGTFTGVSATPDAVYLPVPNTNEDFASAYEVLGGAPVDNEFVTYTGDTRWMSADLHKEMLGDAACAEWPSNSKNASEPGYPDAVFKFRVADPTKTITVSTKGSHHRPTLGVFRLPASGVFLPPTSYSAPSRTQVAYGANPAVIGPGTWPTAFNYQQSGAFNRDYPIPQLPRDAYGRCTDGSTGYSGGSTNPTSTDNPREAFFRIQPTVDANDVTFRVSGAANPVIAVYDKLPPLPESPIAIAGPAGANSNDFFGDFDLGAINDRYVRLIGGDTSATNISANFPAAGFQQADASCLGATGTSRDAVIDFTVSGTQTRRIRVETFRGLDGADEVASNAATFPHLVALIERPVTLTPEVIPVSGNDDMDDAWEIQASSVPVTEGAWIQFSGTLTGAMADVARENVYRPGEPATLMCSNVKSSDPDVVFRFEVDAQSAGSYDFDTVGSQGPTMLSLHKDSVDTYRFVQPLVVDEVQATNSSAAAGQHLGTINGRTVRVVGGNTANSTNKWSRAQIGGGSTSNSCRNSTSGSNDGRPNELVYRFTVASGSAIQTVIRFAPQYNASISLFGPSGTNASGPVANQNVNTYQTCSQVSNGSTAEIRRSLNPGEYYLIVHSPTNSGSSKSGPFALEVMHDVTYTNALELGVVNDKITVVQGDTRQFANKWSAANLAVPNNSNPPGNSTTAGRGCREGTSSSYRPPEVIYRFTVAPGSNRTLNVALSDAFSGAVLGVYSAPGGFTAGSNLGNGLACQASSSASITRSFAPGNYYVVVHGTRTERAGAYTLTITDQSAGSGGVRGCSQGLGARLRNQELTPGTYYLVVKGAGSDYKLNVRRTPEIPPVIACNRDGLGTNRGVLEVDLPAGKNYSVIVRGVTSAQQGQYGVIIRDVGYAPAPLACANAAGYAAPAGTSSDSFTMDLRAGQTYYVAVRSNGNISSSTNQAYSLTISNSTAQSWCNYQSSDSSGAELKQTFPAGEYYAVIKGNSDVSTNSGWSIPASARGRGWYQFTIGDANLKKSQSYTPPLWGNATSGVFKELVDRRIRVITVTATGKAKDQGQAISIASGGVKGSNAIWKELKSDGSGLDADIVDAIAELTDNLAMDVSVQWIPLPDNPLDVVANAGNTFVFNARAVPPPGGTNNGCDGIDATGTKHLNCAPGASPRFEITFTNPSPNSIKPNPDDPQGGYRMQLALVGNDQVIFERIPVYIIPREEPTDQPARRYAEWGSYTQDARANGCFGTERPNWRWLGWSATIPTGTRIEWRVCTGETQAELDACSYVLAAGVSTGPGTNGATCNDDSQCPSGYCGTAEGNKRLCHNVSGPACESDAECGANGYCSPSKQCVWTKNTIPLTPAIQGMNGKRLARLEARLFSNEDRTLAPVLHTYNLEYLCQPLE